MPWQETWILAKWARDRNTSPPFVKSRNREGPRQEKEGSRAFSSLLVSSHCASLRREGEESGKGGVYMHLVLAASHSFSLTRFHCNSREYSLRHLSHKARASPRTGTCPWVTGCSVALMSRVWTDGHVHSIFTMPYGWRSGVHSRPHGDGMAPANVTGWV